MADNKSGEDQPSASGADKKDGAKTKKAAPKTKKPASTTKKTAATKPAAKPSTSAKKTAKTKPSSEAEKDKNASANDNTSPTSKISSGFESVVESIGERVEKIKGKIDPGKLNTDKLKDAYQKNIGETFENITSHEKISESYEQAKEEARHISWLSDIKSCFRFYTRLPLPSDDKEVSINARSLWAAPLVGLVVGLLGGLGYMLSVFLGLPEILAASLAVAIMVLVTGCFHEDAIADLADGFGGGWTKEEKLEIMKDSRIGTYGATALFLTLIVKIGAIASLSAYTSSSLGVLLLLLASSASSRAAGVALLALLPPASETGSARDAGSPPIISLILALFIGLMTSLICLAIGLGFSAMLAGIAGAIIGGGFVGWLANRHIEGATGDVAGTCQQGAEIGMLIAALIALGV